MTRFRFKGHRTAAVRAEDGGISAPARRGPPRLPSSMRWDGGGVKSITSVNQAPSSASIWTMRA